MPSGSAERGPVPALAAVNRGGAAWTWAICSTWLRRISGVANVRSTISPWSVCLTTSIAPEGHDAAWSLIEPPPRPTLPPDPWKKTTVTPRVAAHAPIARMVS
jgi:hypothetical protein